MPQIQLPIFPAGCVELNRDLACRCEGDQVVYFNGHLPVFTHAKADVAAFRMFTSQLIVQGSATQGHIMKAFGVPLISIKRATKVFRDHGAAGFFKPKPRREGRKLNEAKREQARRLIEGGEPLGRVSQHTGVLVDTLRKAIAAGRLPALCFKKKLSPRVSPGGPSNKRRRRLLRPGGRLGLSAAVSALACGCNGGGALADRFTGADGLRHDPQL